MDNDFSNHQLLRLLQLASPLLPVGGYSYSEGLENLISQGIIGDRATLQAWIDRELEAGAIRIETAMMDRAYVATMAADSDLLHYWNDWLSAARETAELRLQSWQMGGSLAKLALELTPELSKSIDSLSHYNYAIVYGAIACHWQIDRQAAIAAYLQCWATNAIGAGIKLIPLGQTAGQQILWTLSPTVDRLVVEIPSIADEDLFACSWGLSLASMQHETLYSRLFRS
jgi:urease accessory protein